MQPAERIRTAASYVAEEWRTIAEIASRLAAIAGPRTSSQSADLDAGLVHYRCVVNFCCGNYMGKWRPEDIQPEDFLGRPWWPSDEELDRRLRGRLPGINRALAHLSWERLDATIIWPFGLLAHEADHVLRLFLSEVPKDASWSDALRSTANEVSRILPPQQTWGATPVEPALARGAMPRKTD